MNNDKFLETLKLVAHTLTPTGRYELVKQHQKDQQALAMEQKRIELAEAKAKGPTPIHNYNGHMAAALITVTLIALLEGVALALVSLRWLGLL